MDHPWEEQMEEPSHENSVAGSGVIAKLPESSVAATTAETHRADLFLCWSSNNEKATAKTKQMLLQAGVVSTGSLNISAPMCQSHDALGVSSSNF